jgi:aryl-alcohol dehydrogenase-like predicted oxidoreductase
MTIGTNKVKGLAEYGLLGRTGLRVSPLCLGTMTFGTEWGFGSDAETARAILMRYIEAGGNFLDTADMYTNGHSEEMLGRFIKDGNLRDEVVLATKYTFSAKPGDPNAGGNGRKNLHRALEGSLRRLQTDHVDLYWLHSWDMITPVEEVVSSLDALVKAGKVRYIGFSNTPSWYLAQAHTLATLRAQEAICALQLEYSLVERNIEHEFVPAALHLGLGICPWSPLGGGFLSGKYERGGAGEGRLKTNTNPVFSKFSDKNWKVLDALREVASAVERPPAQVAVNWITRRPGVSSTIIGATKMTQLEDNLAALDFTIPAELAAKLEAASRPERGTPYVFFGPELQGMISGGTSVNPGPGRR